MQRKNKIILLLLSEITFLFLIYILTSSIFLTEKTGISQTNYDNILPLDTKHSYIKYFVSDNNNLNSVSVLLKNPALKSKDKIKINLLNNQKQTFQSLEITGQSVEDPGWVKIKFSPINSKVGDTFYIETISDAKNDNDLYIYGNKENQSINYKTTYKSPNFRESLKSTFIEQKNKTFQLNKYQLFSYLIIVIILNILIFLSL